MYRLYVELQSGERAFWHTLVKNTEAATSVLRTEFKAVRKRNIKQGGGWKLTTKKGTKGEAHLVIV